MSGLAHLLAEFRDRRVFSGAAWSVGTPDCVLDAGRLGTRRWGGPELDGPVLDGTDLWDLASVTKPIVGLAVMALAERGTLRIGDTIADLLPEYRGGGKASVTVGELLTHTSGLPGRVPLYRTHSSREALLRAVRDLPLGAAPGERVEYSSQGFIILGLIAEAAAGRPLDMLVDELVCGPLGMTRTRFNPPPAQRDIAVATEECAWRGRLVAGQVHDENAVVLGGVAGHAGLFAPLADLERLGRALARGGTGLVAPETFAYMTRCHTERLNLRRGLAWQGLDPSGSPIGQTLGPDSFGHTGFTGTSLWVDPRTRRYFVLLTNRVHPSRENAGIEQVRHRFHDTAAAL